MPFLYFLDPNFWLPLTGSLNGFIFLIVVICQSQSGLIFMAFRAKSIWRSTDAVRNITLCQIHFSLWKTLLSVRNISPCDEHCSLPGTFLPVRKITLCQILFSQWGTLLSVRYTFPVRNITVCQEHFSMWGTLLSVCLSFWWAQRGVYLRIKSYFVYTFSISTAVNFWGKRLMHICPITFSTCMWKLGTT